MPPTRTPALTDAALFFPLALRLADEDTDFDDLAPASNQVYSPISWHTSADPSGQGPPPPPLATIYDQACARIQGLVGTYLTPDMAAALTSLLSVTHHDLTVRNNDTENRSDSEKVGHQFIHPLLFRVASPNLVSDDALRDMANVINTALVHFAAAGGRTKSQSPPSLPDLSLPPTPVTESAPNNKNPSTRCTQRVSKLCGVRDKNICLLTKRRTGGECSHILPFSLRDEKAVNFWKFIALFRGEEETVALRGALCMGPDSVRVTDNLLNVWWLSEDVHKYFDKGWVTIIPQLTPDQLAYDPAKISEVSPRPFQQLVVSADDSPVFRKSRVSMWDV